MSRSTKIHFRIGNEALIHVFTHSLFVKSKSRDYFGKFEKFTRNIKFCKSNMESGLRKRRYKRAEESDAIYQDSDSEINQFEDESSASDSDSNVSLESQSGQETDRSGSDVGKL